MVTIAATLNAASPGAQADNVTIDANLTYKVYNDTDSYAAAESFGKHGTTGVTVSAGVVTITGVTEPSGVTAYKISSVDEAANESVLSDAFGLTLFSETFPASTLNTNNWVKTGSTDVDDTYNDGLTLTDNKTLSSGTDIFRLESNTKWNYNNVGKDLFIIVNVDTSGILSDVTPRNITLLDTADNNRVGIIQDNDTPYTAASLLTKESGGSVVLTDSIEEFTGSFKISLVSGTANLYKWNGSSWGTSIASHSYVESTDYYLRVQRDTRCTDTQSWVVNHVHALDADISTETP